MREPITIIGAGIGGLTTALVLKNKGFMVTVYESAPEIHPVGAGIIMASNAMQIFQKLGLRQEIEWAGHQINSLKIANEMLQPISILDLSPYKDRYGVCNVAIHRADLQEILAEAVGKEDLRLAKRLIKIEEKEMFTLTFEDNTQLENKIVIGADGIHSIIRKQLFEPSEIRHLGQICWRGVLETGLAEKYPHQAIETWGKGKRFGFVKISHNQLYWFAVLNSGLDTGAGLAELFKEFHPDILEMVTRTSAEDIFESNIIDLRPISKWHRGNLCLLGDAAHATTPNLGQGACQAVEDAFALGQILSSGKSVENAFADYEKVRIKKARYIVNTSYTLGRVAHIENSFFIWLRNRLMGVLSKAASAKQLNRVFDVDYLEKI